MPLITLGDSTKLILKIPSKGDTGWADDFKNEFAQKIVDHDHSGGGLGKPVDILNLDKVQQGVSPGNGNALIWDASANNGIGEFRFLNPATSVNPTAFAITSNTVNTTQAINNSFSVIIPPSASTPSFDLETPGTTGWNTSTGKYQFPTTGVYRLSASVLLNSSREDVSISILARKTGSSTQNIKTITKKVQSNIPVGSIIAWSSASSPGADYLRCDGTAYAETAYPDLKEVIGSTYATHNGNTTPASGNFNVPNHSGEFLRDVGSATITDVEAQATAANGLTAGSSHSLSTSSGWTGYNDLAHRHTYNDYFDSDYSTGLSGYNGGSGDSEAQGDGTGRDSLNRQTGGPINEGSTSTKELNHRHTIPSLNVNGTITTTLTGGDSETRPENTKVAYYIKAKNTVEEQIVLTALVSVTALDELAIMVKTNITDTHGGVEINFNDADTAGFTLDLEKLE